MRGLEGTKEASVVIKPHPEGPLHNKDPVTVNIAVANGLGALAGCWLGQWGCRGGAAGGLRGAPGPGGL